MFSGLAGAKQANAKRENTAALGTTKILHLTAGKQKCAIFVP